MITADHKGGGFMMRFFALVLMTNAAFAGGLESIQDESRLRREDQPFAITGTLAPLDMMIPMKYGAGLSWTSDVDHSVDFDFQVAHLSLPWLLDDLGAVSEQRFNLVRRSFFGTNTFNVYYGLSVSRFAATLGNEYLNTVTNGQYPDVDILRVDSLCLTAGLGNRWIINKNFLLGVDWFGITQPIRTLQVHAPFLDQTTDADLRSAVNVALRVFKYVPRFTLLRVQVGWVF
jgi:hypothetical protein